MVITVVCGELSFFIFTFMSYDEFGLIVSMWDFRNYFSRLSKGKYFLVLLLRAQTKSSSITKDCLRRHWLLYALPDEDIDIFFSDAFETVAYTNNSGVVCVLLSKIPFFVAWSLSGFGILGIYFPFRLCAEMLCKCSRCDGVKVLTTKCHSP